MIRKPPKPITGRMIAAINNFNSLASGRGEVEIPKPRAPSRDLEWREQCGVIQWWRYAHKHFGIPENLLFSIPNGGMLGPIKGAKLKASGTRAGVSDLFLPVARGPFHGLFCEMKSTEGTEQEAQVEFIANVHMQGYAAQFCYGANEAILAIKTYLENR